MVVSMTFPLTFEDIKRHDHDDDLRGRERERERERGLAKGSMYRVPAQFSTVKDCFRRNSLVQPSQLMSTELSNGASDF